MGVRRRIQLFTVELSLFTPVFVFLTRFNFLIYFLLLILNFLNWLQALRVWQVEENDKVPLWGGFVMRCCFILSIICGRSVGVAITAKQRWNKLWWVIYVRPMIPDPLCAVNLTPFWRNMPLGVFRVSIPWFHNMCDMKSNQNVLGISPKQSKTDLHFSFKVIASLPWPFVRKHQFLFQTDPALLWPL